MRLKVLEAKPPKWNWISEQAGLAVDGWLGDKPYERVHRQLLTHPSDNLKLAKSKIPTYGLTLAPAGASGYQLCPWRSPECEAGCLGITAGNARYPSVMRARIAKTQLLMTNPLGFIRQLLDELWIVHQHTPKFLFRSNVLSDIPWETVCPTVYSFARDNYDYTKSYDRAVRNLKKQQDPDYEGHSLHLVLSFSGHNWSQCCHYMDIGGNAAVVFRVGKDESMPRRYDGYQVIDGDIHDDRTSDPPHTIVGLRPKGNIPDSPFVVNL